MARARASSAAKSSARQRDGAERGDAMAGVAVKVRSAGHGEPERRGQRAVARSVALVVIGVAHLDRGQPGGHQRGIDRRRAASAPGCASETIPPAAVTMATTSRGRRAAARHERRTTVADEAIERVARSRAWPAATSASGDLRTADAPAVVHGAGRQQRVDVDRTAERAQPIARCRRRGGCDRRAAPAGTRRAPESAGSMK